MADVPKMPGAPLGAEPGKKTTGKVAPKKETVRINLPPKPSAAPTIKLPTLPPGGPAGIQPGAPGIRPPTAARPAPAAAAAQRPAPAPPAAMRAPAPAMEEPTLEPLDRILAIAAMVAALFAIASAVYLGVMLNIGS
ncbi:MAG: hypothetical protein KGJ88_10780 [Verrucomicrobiota bacterium]|nr:hypothetical protein [Verrucomicrobiota bacterium]